MRRLDDLDVRIMKELGSALAYLDRIARMYPMPPSVNPIRAMRMNAVIGYSKYCSTCTCT